MLYNVYVPQRLIFRELFPHAGLESTIKSFNDASFGLFAVCSEMTDAFLSIKKLQLPIQKLFSFVRLHCLWSIVVP